MGAGPVLPLRTLRPPSFGRGVNAWSVGAAVPVQQLEGVGVESRGRPGQYCPVAPSALTQIVPNSSSLFTLLYSVIYNSVYNTVYTVPRKKMSGLN